MNKQILLAALFVAGTGLMAQETAPSPAPAAAAPAAAKSTADRPVSKKGYAILPEAGDIALGFNAIPFFRYVGNTFNGNTNNSVNTGFVNSYQTIYGKYFLADNMAVRAQLRIGSSKNDYNNYIKEDGANNPDQQVEDRFSQNISNNAVGAGIEMRRGDTRLQGFYGAELFVRWGKESGSYSYGNEISAYNVTPTHTTNFPSSTTTSNTSDRITSYESGKYFGFGARAFCGVEYFFAPKISVSAEFGWGLVIDNRSEGVQKRERFTNAYETYEVKSGTVDRRVLDTDNFNGSINMFFHF
jgi:hypothetical protein